MITFREELKKAEEKCEENKVYTQVALNYLLELSQKKRIDLYQMMDDEMPKELLEEYESGMKRILSHEPMQHVLGYSWFYGYKMKVDSNVLIPRPETEELVSYILSEMDATFEKDQKIDVVDVGTGSGAIAIALAKEDQRVNMMATDISKEALKVAQENATMNSANIEFVAGDMLTPLIEHGKKVDVLISNPPYIPAEEEIEVSVKDFEPHVALFGGSDGLKFYRMIFEKCHLVLKDRGFMAFEMGWNQGESLVKLVQSLHPHLETKIVKDMNGKGRMLFIKWKGEEKNV